MQLLFCLLVLYWCFASALTARLDWLFLVLGIGYNGLSPRSGNKCGQAFTSLVKLFFAETGVAFGANMAKRVNKDVSRFSTPTLQSNRQKEEAKNIKKEE